MKNKNIMIAIPNTGMVQTNYMAQMLGLYYGSYAISYQFLKSSLIYISREKFVTGALNNNCDYLLFIDTDQKIPRDIIPRMAKYLDDGEDIVTALIFTKEPPYNPCVYSESKRLETGQLSLQYCKINKETIKPFYVENCGSGCVMMKTEIFRKIPSPWFSMPFYLSGEDVTFFHRATQEFGYKILCDPSLEVGHWGTVSIDRNTHLKYAQEQENIKNGDIL